MQEKLASASATGFAPVNEDVEVSTRRVRSDTSASEASESKKGPVEGYHYKKEPFYRVLIYNLILGFLLTIFDCFFREIRTRGGFKVPRQGPVIFVAAPHANQFVDPVILMGQVKKVVNRRVSFLVAEKSLKRKAIGFFSRCVMSIGVVRAQDNLKPAKGKITVDPENPRKLIGHGTTFLTDFKPKGLIGLPKSLGNVEIDSIESETTLTLRKEFKMGKPEVKHILTKGTPFKYADKVNQSMVYHKVFEHLAHNQCIGIFPEGGSHDRTDLLPLKAGVAIMALGCMEKHPDANVKIVPCGMNYFHPHKFRSRAVVEFGDPLEIPPELVEKYRSPETNREAVKELLDTISEGLKAVTVTCSDYDTLMVVQAMRRLYAGQLSSRLPLPMVVEMNRRLVKGYQTYKNDPRIIGLKKEIMTYNAHLRHYNLPDHLVERDRMSFIKNLWLLCFRSARLLVMLVLALPGIIMFLPVFIVAKRISKQKAREALAASTVKIKANDVIATWKILIGMGFAPLLYTLWSILISYLLRNRFSHNKLITFMASYLACSAVTYSALLVGDIGMDTFKSLRPLYLSITTPQGLRDLQKERNALAEKITSLINTLGPELFPDFDADSLRHEYEVDEEEEDRKTAELKRRRLLRKKKIKNEVKQAEKLRAEKGDEKDEASGSHTDSDAVSLVNSENSLSNIPIFSNAAHAASEGSMYSTGGASSGSEFSIDERISVKDDVTGKIAQAIWNSRCVEDDE
ncbi:SCT1 (YBL011W) [Zygosaccharomyces parabailii]|nr:SCT1 (YBL011W) [Zygosaccharomyces parabailii]CDH15398.1 probable Glycerol-3-phosphate O-acyltransferase 1 [Zygosaccharomyces bailii ISA1307]